jgi:hypothetical protein
VTSDLLRSIDGILSVAVCDAQDHPLFEQELKVDLVANENRKFFVEGLQEFLQSTPAAFVKIQLTEGETLTAERLLDL